MLSTSSGIAKRHITHRRMNSAGAIHEATQVRPLPTNAQRAGGHRRGISLQGQPVFPGHGNNQMMPQTNIQQHQQQDFQGVSMDTNRRQHSQQIQTQVAQQQHQAPPGIQITIPDTPQTSSNNPYLGLEGLREPDKSSKKQKLFEKMKELQELMQEYNQGGGDLKMNMSLMTPDATPQKPNFPVTNNNVDFAPMPTSLDDLQEVKFPFDNSYHGLRSPVTDNGYDSDSISPTHSSRPHQQSKSIEAYVQQAGAFPANVARQLFAHSGLQPVPELRDDQIFDGMIPRRNSQIAIAGVVVDATIEDTGISPEDVQQFISPQNADGRWICQFPGCDRSFGRRENIRAHVQTHLGDRQYRCNHCNKCFVRQHDLKRHAKIHTGDKSHKCACGTGFARQDALTRHKQRGMCIGGYPNPDKKIVKRGRPKKSRPDMEDRLDKSARTRKALASAASHSTGSPHSIMSDDDCKLDTSPLDGLQSLQSSSDPNSDLFSDFESLSVAHNSPLSSANGSFDSFDHDIAGSVMMSRTATSQTSSSRSTPPMSPSTGQTPASVGSPEQVHITPALANQLAQLTTPPGSPPPMETYDSLFSANLDFNAFCGSDMDNNAMDAFIVNGLNPMDSIDMIMDFKDF